MFILLCQEVPYGDVPYVGCSFNVDSTVDEK